MAVFDVSNDVARHATPQQLHFGDENFPRPIFAVSKPDYVSPNEISVAERDHCMLQSFGSRALP